MRLRFYLNRSRQIAVATVRRQAARLRQGYGGQGRLPYNSGEIGAP
jgi:ribosomal protein L44E